MLMVMMSPLMSLCWFILLLSVMVVISSKCWSVVWVGLEFNMISLLVLMNSGGKFSLEPLIKYFISQSVGSTLMVAGFLMSSEEVMNVCYVITLLGLYLKLGFFPFHSWVPSVVMQIRYTIIFLMLTWQKLAPLSLMMVFPNNYMNYFSLMFMVIIGSIGGLNQASVRGMLAYSSFVHSSWIILALINSFMIFMMYFLCYSISLLIFITCCKVYGKSNLKTKMVSITGCMSLLMLMGVPPFLGFLPKLLLFISFPSFVLVFCISGSLISLKFYLSFFYSFLMSSGSKLTMNLASSYSSLSCFMVNMMGILFFMLLTV